MTRTENKSLIKLAVATVLLILCVAMVPVKTQAANPVTFTFTTDTIILSWETPTVSSGTIDSYSIYDVNTKTYIQNDIPGTDTSYAVKKSEGYVGYWRVEYKCTSSYGTQYTYTLGSTYVNTKPNKISSKNYGIAYAYPSTQRLSFGANKATGMTGTHIALYKGSKKIKDFEFTSTSDFWSYSLDKVYKYKARAYYSNYTTGETYYGDWSDYKYFEVPTSKGTYKYGTKGLNVSVKYCSGVKNFTISVSTKKDSGYKKFATLTPTSKSKTKSVLVNKYGSKSMKKGTTYYVMVTPNIKVGSSTKKSDLQFYYSYNCTK